MEGGRNRGRICNRAYGFVKSDSKLNFRIVRHPGAFSRGYDAIIRTKVSIKQLWQFSFEDLNLTQIKSWNT